jgi:membrane protease YdiL (CAAX protease family)
LYQFIEVGPASSIERVIFIIASVIAGICEEIIFRGYAITRLGKLLKSNWLVLIISTVCHVFLHGVPDSIEQFFSYFVLGIIFGGAFILMKTGSQDAG